ncbi:MULTISPECIES: hypothetical protein [unclassified Roseitalea]|uniref:hypothetical protein n=1 Tax=unclassified Roseitalea TaxID=2639107 RepID=UPI00273F68A7|nr:MULTISPECIES: hypothetical protein [unclassified Roseitalea]
MSDNGSGNDPRRYAAYALIGAGIGAVLVWFVADGFSLAALGSGVIGGAVAGVVAGIIRTRSGLDR